MRTRSPITEVSPMTMPVPWSMNNASPMVAPAVDLSPEAHLHVGQPRGDRVAQRRSRRVRLARVAGEHQLAQRVQNRSHLAERRQLVPRLDLQRPLLAVGVEELIDQVAR